MSSSPPNPRALVALALAAALASACADDAGGALALGLACGDDGACASRFCDGVCREPTGDDDGDGLTNEDERARGTSPDHGDSDRDGLSDLTEGLGDLDDDGRLDALESALVDADQDCLPAELDPDESTREARPEALAAALCRRDGVCAGGRVEARCDHIDVVATTLAVIACDYDGVEGWDGSVEISCDGRDNDCDGRTDEDLGVIDSTGAVRALGATCQGTGACATRVGVVECDAASRARCSVDAGGSDAPAGGGDLDCDAIDNDCDGATDEHVSWIDPATGQARAFGAPCAGLGACGLGLGVVECAASSGRGICSLEPGGSADASGPESCNGLDDDCDGRTDEDLAWLSPDGRPLAIGQPCGLGACAGGVVMCGGGLARCSSGTLAGPEQCDGEDDDCDGATDELDDLTLECPSEGVCAELELVSVTCDPIAGALACELADPDGVREPEGETRCNGLDDDCDGLTDEDLTPRGGDPLGGACEGRGACAGPGVVVCAADGVGVRCSADVTDAVEACNGIDDDCDGATDEELAEGPPACATVGVCSDYAAIPATCAGGAWRCEHASDPAWEPDEATCDALDNDCDGDVDEGLPRRPRGTWTIAPGSPTERLRWPMAAWPDGVWLFGGAATGAGIEAASGSASSGDAAPTLLGDLWRYDVAQARWEREPAPGGPSPRAGHALAWEPHHGVLLVHGGFTAATGAGALGPDGAPVGSMFVFDPHARAWSVVTDRGAEERPAAWFYRRYHALAALGDGRLLIHGGLVSGLDANGLGMLTAPLTATGTLAQEDGAWVVTWEVADDDLAATASWRFGHTLAPLGDVVVALGGRALGGEPLPTIDARAALGWSSLPDLTLPGDFPAAGEHDGTLLVATLASAHRLSLDPLALTPIDAPDGQPIARAGAVTHDAGVAVLVEGATPEGDAGRRTFRLDEADREAPAWGEPAPWRLPAPRVGASLVADATGGLVLVGGARRLGGGALQDAWRLEPDGETWTALAPASPPGVVAADRPALVGASAIWDDAGGRLLIFGGADVTRAPAAPGEALWTYDLDAFTRLEALGDPPPARARRELVKLIDDLLVVGAEPDGRVALWDVTLDASAATFAERATAPAPQEGLETTRALVAAGPLGARLALILQEGGALVVRAWDPRTSRWHDAVALDGAASVPLDGSAPRTWDAAFGRVFVLGPAAFATLDLGRATASSVTLAGAWPPSHPALAQSRDDGRLVGFGGLHLAALGDARGPATARTFTFGLECAPP